MPVAAYRFPVETALASVRVAPLEALVALRKARIAAGLTLAIMTVGAIAWPAVGASNEAPFILMAAWPVAAAAGLLAYAIARATAQHGQSAADLERTLYGLEVPALAAPAAGLAFALPLTAHLAVVALAALASTSSHESELREFGNWMVMSGIIVGHAHVAVAIHAYLTIDRMHRLPSHEAPARGAWLQSLGIATLCGAVPGAILILIPPILVLVTGLPLLPLLYGFIRRTLMDERAHIATTLAQRELPTAAAT